METKLVITNRTVKQHTSSAVFPLLQRWLTFFKPLLKHLTASRDVNFEDAYEGHPDQNRYAALRRDL